MDWSAKIEMCNLGQNPDTIDEFKECVLNHIDSFDLQAWDMFLSVFSISEENVHKHAAFLKKLLPRLEAFDESESSQSLTMSAFIRLGTLIDRIKHLPLAS